MINTTKIYLVTNIDNDPNKVYIGKTKNSREKAHKRTFGFQIIYIYIDEINSLNKEDWEPLETKWIQHYIDLGYNVVNKKKKGGSGPEYISDETKYKMSIAKLGKSFSNEHKLKLRKPKSEKTKQNISKALFGKKKTNEHCYKVSKAKQGKPVINGRISINQYDLQDNFIKEWSSLTEAQKQLNIKGIGNVLRGLAMTAGGYKWKYKNLKKAKPFLYI